MITHLQAALNADWGREDSARVQASENLEVMKAAESPFFKLYNSCY
jgi:hypothetical protein